MSKEKIVMSSSATPLGLNDLFSVKGKVVLVTGGGTGIGKMLAAGLVANGAKVYIASRKQQVVDETAAELNKYYAKQGGVCLPLTANLNSKAGCDELANKIKQRETKLDALFNNSGITWGAPMLDFPEKEGWDQLYAVNVKGPFFLTTALLPLLEKASNGNYEPATVVNVSSIGGIIASSAEGRDDDSGIAKAGSGTPSYASSKAAVNHLTRTLATSLASRYVRVNCIAPGAFPSRMMAFGLSKPGAKQAMDSSVPLGRIGETEDMAGLAVFLASRASAHITGAVFTIDGGSSIIPSGQSRI
ncbi:hypothetical protein SmJEL517_g04689 [Synchytrium microbalum]|uniref:Gluconate 5-dehydrogenase n=1 Tax=Synchytrium microbalum TaxID=1806994 RepID=A0A507C3L7_9FUNG|nr:uncharacterized protein SmJEL517_g04689 [Synchytrium microbalum]TPX32113.1 hypothetical protein SmJEL517_g04689 [Synchytrium microbalum]